MVLCKICKTRKHCREICPALNKELSTRNVSPRQKDKTYDVDIPYLEDAKNPFNDFQKEVAAKLVHNDWDSFFSRLDFAETIDKALTPREKLIIKLTLEGYTQQEIAQKFKISKRRINVVLQRARAKIKKFT